MQKINGDIKYIQELRKEVKVLRWFVVGLLVLVVLMVVALGLTVDLLLKVL